MAHIVFISRKISEEHSEVNDFKKKIILKDTSLIEFKEESYDINFSKTDIIFFYSKNAVTFFLQKNKSFLERELPLLACMGKGTAYALQGFGYPSDFIGQGTPQEIASDFLKISEGKKVLFPRAKNSKQSIQKLLKNKIIDIDLVIYDNIKKNNFEDPLADILIFTSPLNVEAYFDAIPYRDEKIIAIGKTTEKKLLSLGLQNIIVSPQSTERSVLETALKIINVE